MGPCLELNMGAHLGSDMGQKMEYWLGCLGQAVSLGRVVLAGPHGLGRLGRPGWAVWSIPRGPGHLDWAVWSGPMGCLGF